MKEDITLKEIVEYYTDTGKTEPEIRQDVIETGVSLDIPEEKESLDEIINKLLLEKLYEDALERRLDLIEEGLYLIANGRQYPTEIGRIDLLAKDDSGQYVVIELKKDKTEDKVVGQTLRYMGWVRNNLSPTNLVRGVIVGRDSSEKMEMALRGLQHPYKNLMQFKKLQVDVQTRIS